MKIPKKLKVGGQIYDVIFPWVFKEDDSMVGLHESKECQIKLAYTYRGEKIPVARIKQTFLHEILHAVDFYYTCHILTGDEDVIDRFAEGWFNVLINNNLNLTSKKFEFVKVLKIRDYSYKVIYPYTYLDMCPAPQFSVDTNMNTIKFSDDHLKSADSIKKMNLVHALNVILNCEDNILGSSKLCNNGNIENLSKEAVLELFSNGIFQVLLDNNVEKVIKNG